MEPICLSKIRRVYQFTMFEQNWSYNGNSGHVLAYKLYGQTDHICNGKLYRHADDTVMYYNNTDTFQVTCNQIPTDRSRGREKNGFCIAVHFNTVGEFPHHMTVVDCAGYPQVKAAFFRMSDAWNSYQHTGRESMWHECVSDFYDIWAQLSAIEEDGGVPDTEKRMTAARDFLDRNFADSTLTIADAARQAGFGQRRFGDLFEERYGVTPGKYLTRRRLLEAQRLLSEGRLSVSEIAAGVGFSGTSYFIRVFRQNNAVTPNEYRLAAMKRESEAFAPPGRKL